MSGRSGVIRRLARVESERESLLASLEGLGEEALRRRPAPDTWSILEVVEHMVQAEDFCLMNHRDADALEVRPRSLRQRLAYELVVLILEGPVRVSAPVKAMNPEGTATLHELAERWRESQARLRSIVESTQDPRRDAVFRHPVAGPMTPAQAVRMLDAHQRRHIRQIEKRRG